jgi:hypothetical protein
MYFLDSVIRMLLLNGFDAREKFIRVRLNFVSCDTFGHFDFRGRQSKKSPVYRMNIRSSVRLFGGSGGGGRLAVASSKQAASKQQQASSKQAASKQHALLA